jgi:tetratricopeptide (TPR) repeat protein
VSLSDQSLVQQASIDEQPRFSLLAAIREYALEQLEESGEEQTVRNAHAQWYLEFVERTQEELANTDQRKWLDSLEREHDDLRAALQWLFAGRTSADRSESTTHLETGLRICSALWQFWEARGHWNEGRRWLETGLGVADAVLGPVGSVGATQNCSVSLRQVRANALSAAGALAYDQGNYEIARKYHEESLLLRTDLNDKAGISSSLNNLGAIAVEEGKYEDARRYHQQSLALRRELGDKRRISSSLLNLAVVESSENNLDSARALYEESLVLAREVQGPLQIALRLNNLGSVAELQGDFSTARRYLEESLALQRVLDAQSDMAVSLINLGFVARDEGKYDEARSHFLESLALLKGVGDKRFTAECLEGLAGTLALLGQEVKAVMLLGAAERLRNLIGALPKPSERQRYERYFSAVRTLFEQPAWDVAWSEGQFMSMDEVIDFALA